MLHPRHWNFGTLHRAPYSSTYVRHPYPTHKPSTRDYQRQFQINQATSKARQCALRNKTYSRHIDQLNAKVRDQEDRAEELRNRIIELENRRCNEVPHRQRPSLPRIVPPLIQMRPSQQHAQESVAFQRKPRSTGLLKESNLTAPPRRSPMLFRTTASPSRTPLSS